MGIVTVASLAARVTDGAAVTMTSTLRRTSSAASAGKRSSFSPAVGTLGSRLFLQLIAQEA